jgi:branched-chain amino acid transport system substrate-binding protein
VAGESAEGVVFPLLFDPESAAAADFVRAYEKRWSVPPDFLAAHAYDAARLLVDCIRRAGPNRALIRDAVAEAVPWSGVAGKVTWDATGRSESPVVLGVWREGRVRKR